MSTHTIFDELSQLANQLGISTSGCHNIKDILRRMTAVHGGNSNGRAIADAVKNMKFTLPFQIADAPSALSIGNVTLTPSYDDDVYSYIGAVSGESEEGELTVTAASGTEVAITFNGNEVETGDTLEFVNGANVLVVTVSQDDVAPVTYTITFPFQRVAKDLSTLAIANVTLDPAFAAGTYEYDGLADSAYYQGALTVTAAEGNTYVATFNGETVESGDTLEFVDGDNALNVVVSREDSADKVYDIWFEWEQPSADDLTAFSIANVTLTPTFGAGVYEYTGALAEGETSGAVAFTADTDNEVTATFNGASVASGDTLEFSAGDNELVVTVTKAHCKNVVYTIVVHVDAPEGGEG